jgi:branched-chain amino acid transport system permease protein
MRRTWDALAQAAAEARVAWTARASLLLVALAAAALVPLWAPSATVDTAARGLLTALAATGLAFAIGLAGLPSLGQGAFLAVGAFAAALLRVHLELPLAPAVLAGALAAAAAGIVVGVGVVRLQPVFVAVTTWLATWLVGLALAAFPDLSGGAQGLTLEPGLGLSAHYELALALLAGAVLAFWSLRSGLFGIRLAAVGQREPAALALGVPAARLRLWAFTASAAVGGIAGALLVDLEGVADASEFDADRSFELFVAVLVGGAAHALGAPAGVAVLAAAAAAAHELGSAFGVETARFDPVLSALMLLAVLSLGGEGLVPSVLRRLPPARRGPPEPAPTRRADRHGGLDARGLVVRFGALEALADLSLELRPGRVTALIGPNGSGKTTALRVLSGRLPPQAGAVRLDGLDAGVLDESARVARGVVRTLQTPGVFPHLTALENVLVSAAGRAEDGGPFRTLAATPRARAAASTARSQALGALDRVGLRSRWDVPAGELGGFEQRLLAIAAASATAPTTLLLDEPSAGAGVADIERLAEVVDRLRAEGVAVLLVEHNLRLVRLVADTVVVLAAGRAIATGPPDEVAASPAVREAYLGSRRL